MKYAIDKQFGIYRFMKTPVMPTKLAGFMGSLMRPPRRIFKWQDIVVTKQYAQSVDGEAVEILLMTPKALQKPSPCLVYFHGGGFFFGAAGYHYDLARRYALEASCQVAFVQYRLAPKHPFPIPAEDCFSAYCEVVKRAAEWGIDDTRIAVGGDSAGGCLAAATAQMCRDRRVTRPCCQLLVYPVADRRMNTPSYERFTDTPMWHARLSKKMWEAYLPDTTVNNIAYASPMEATSFEGLPPAYVETAQFDCLHDEGVAYADALEAAGISVTRNDTIGTMHGFDNAPKTAITKEAVSRRIAFLKNWM